MPRNNSIEAVCAVKEYLDSHKLHYSFNDEHSTFRMRFGMDNRFGSLEIAIAVRGDTIAVHSLCPISVNIKDKALMVEASMMVCRMNYGLTFGKFDLDLRDGELVFVSGFPFINSETTGAMLTRAIAYVMWVFDRYASAIIGVLLGSDTAKEAVEYADKNASKNKDDEDDSSD